MKYYSEILKKNFDTEEECFEAEKQYQLEKKGREEKISKQKKELAKAIDEATKKVEEAEKLYDIAQDEAAEILEESNKKVNEILSKAQNKVKEAQKERVKAIREFNDKFGVYTTTITGEEAAEELRKTMKQMANFWLDFFRF